MKTFLKFPLLLALAIGFLTLASCKDEPIVVEYSINATVGEYGSIMVTIADVPASKAVAGDEVTLIATPDKGYKFARWIVGGVELSDPKANPATFTMPANDVSVSGEFVDENSLEYGITITSDGNGTATADLESALPGTTITIQAVADKGYDFGEWTIVEGHVELTKLNRGVATFTMPAEDVEIAASFVDKPFNAIDYMDDEKFIEKMLKTCDFDGDRIISREEADQVRYLDISHLAPRVSDTPRIKSVAGLELFTNLIELDCSRNDITKLDLTMFPELTKVWCGSNLRITSLDLSRNPKLTELLCNSNDLVSLDLSNNPELSDLSISNNFRLASLDLTKNTKLKSLFLGPVSFTTLDLSKNTMLTTLGIGGENLTSLDLSKNTALTSFSIDGCSKLTSIDLSNNTKLLALWIVSCPLITSVDLSKNTALENVVIVYTGLTSIDVSNNTEVSYMELYMNQLNSIDISKNTKLGGLNISYNNLTSLDITNNPMRTLLCSGNNISSLDLSNSNLAQLECIGNNLTSLDFSNGVDLSYFYCDDNNLTSLDLSNNTGNLYEFSCAGNNISSLSLPTTGTQWTYYMNCSGNELTSLDVSNFPELETLNVANNKLTSLNIAGTYLLTFVANYNNLDYTSLRTMVDDLPNRVGDYFGTMECAENPGSAEITEEDFIYADNKNWYLYYYFGQDPPVLTSPNGVRERPAAIPEKYIPGSGFGNNPLLQTELW